MTYNFKYRLSNPTARNDGSGMVDHQTEAVYESAPGVWEQVPGHDKTICVPAEEMKTVLDMSNGAAKVTAYKQLLATNLYTQAEPLLGWSMDGMTIMLDNNQVATDQLARFKSWVEDDLSLVFPVSFSM